ncbi:PEP-CTERM sorting domain-containing protein [Nitrosospira multiformis]|nr:PEP-CTERM sorting domain-containing protein [Nitrosospira multiformis]
MGISATAEGADHVFITDPSGVGMADLDSQVELPVGFFLAPGLHVQINNVGQVAASIIPEPQSYALILAGLILVGFIVRRKSMVT